MTFITLGFAFTLSGVRNALLIGEEFSFNFKSIFVSQFKIVPSSSSTFKSDKSKVTGKTLHFTLNILATCFNHFSKLPVIEAIAVIIKFHKL
ncbi:MAG: hypothetical protein LBC61_00555 [Candidatus Peribacteria bacterium]|jgi:hypothetical protein|nr:hypothetical protein [Candidatus Peribacteria bacterium]